MHQIANQNTYDVNIAADDVMEHYNNTLAPNKNPIKPNKLNLDELYSKELDSDHEDITPPGCTISIKPETMINNRVTTLKQEVKNLKFLQSSFLKLMSTKTKIRPKTYTNILNNGYNELYVKALETTSVGDVVLLMILY